MSESLRPNPDQQSHQLRKPDAVRDETILAKISYLDLKVGIEAEKREGVNLSDFYYEIPDLEGADNGLYERLKSLAKNIDITVEDDDEKTKDILKNGGKGLHKKFSSGWVAMIKQGSPLQMSAVLAHEIEHHLIPRATNDLEYNRNEAVVEGASFIVCDNFGLDTSPQAFPYIAGYTQGIPFTSEIGWGIHNTSSYILNNLRLLDE